MKFLQHCLATTNTHDINILQPGLFEFLNTRKAPFGPIRISGNFEHVRSLQHTDTADMPTLEEPRLQNWVPFVICSANENLLIRRPASIHRLRLEAHHATADLKWHGGRIEKMGWPIYIYISCCLYYDDDCDTSFFLTPKIKLRNCFTGSRFSGGVPKAYYMRISTAAVKQTFWENPTS